MILTRQPYYASEINPNDLFGYFEFINFPITSTTNEWVLVHYTGKNITITGKLGYQ